MRGPSSGKIAAVNQKWDQFGSSGYCKTFALAMDECEGHAELVIAAAQCLCYFQLPLGRGQARWSSTNTSLIPLIPILELEAAHIVIHYLQGFEFSSGCPRHGGPVTFNLTDTVQVILIVK